MDVVGGLREPHGRRSGATNAVAELADRLEAEVTAGELPPAAAARQILDAFLRDEK